MVDTLSYFSSHSKRGVAPWVVGHILHGGYIELFLITQRARRSAMVPWVVGHILHGGYIELFLGSHHTASEV